MGFMSRKSQLRSRIIKKVILNKKGYKFQDFNFFVLNSHDSTFWGEFQIVVENFNTPILKLQFTEKKILAAIEKRFDFEVVFFNPQTDNDCYSINHIIATFSELAFNDSKDYGNAEVIDNQFVFRKKDNYYSYVKVWKKGEIKSDNFDRDLSFSFATNEYISYLKKLYGCKKIQRRAIKEYLSNVAGKLTREKMMDRLNAKG